MIHLLAFSMLKENCLLLGVIWKCQYKIRVKKRIYTKLDQMTLRKQIRRPRTKSLTKRSLRVWIFCATTNMAFSLSMRCFRRSYWFFLCWANFWIKKEAFL